MLAIVRNIFIICSAGLMLLVVACGVSTENIDVTVEARIASIPTSTPQIVIQEVEKEVVQEVEVTATPTPVPTATPEPVATAPAPTPTRVTPTVTPIPLPTVTPTPTPTPLLTVTPTLTINTARETHGYRLPTGLTR